MSSERSTRSAVLEVEHVALASRAANDDRLPVSISSELPVERSDWETGARYLEILEHSADAVDLSRAARGLPLLLSHDPSDTFGIVEDVRVGNDRKLRGFMRFSKSARAQEIRQDILDGLRSSVSLGYSVGPFTESRAKDGTLTRRYSRWTPFEVSTLAIPADHTVGVNRAQPAAVHTPKKGSQMTDEQHSEHADHSRTHTILGMASAANLSLTELNTFLRSDKTPDQIGRELLSRMNGEAQHSGAPQPNNGQGRTSAAFHTDFCEALFAKDGQAAREATRELSKSTGLKSAGNFVRLHERTMTSTGVGSGRELSPILQGDLVDLMRPRMVAAAFGARSMSYNGGTVSLPVITADASFSWLAENPASGVAASNLGTAAITMRPHAVSTRTTHSAQSLRTSDPETASVIMASHAARLAVAVDQAALAGLGASDQPRGILHTAGVPIIAAGTNGAAISYGLLCQLEGAIDAANNPLEGLGFVTTPALRGRMRQTLDFPSASAGRPLFSFENTVLGHRALTSTSMPSTLSKGTANGTLHSAILGDFTQLQIGYWAGLELIVDPYSDASRGLVHITSTLYVDVAVLQPGAFARITDLTLA